MIRIPIALFAACLIVPTARVYAQDYTTPRLNRLSALVGPTTSYPTTPRVTAAIQNVEGNAAAALSLMDRRENWTTHNQIFTDLPFTLSPTVTQADRTSHITGTFGRLRDLAIAYSTPGANSSYYNNASVLQTVRDGMNWMIVQTDSPSLAPQYVKGASEVGGWWDWSIGSPLAINDVITVLYSSLDPVAERGAWLDAEASFWHGYHTNWQAHKNDPNPEEDTGANLMWHCEIIALRGVLRQNPDEVQSGVNAVGGVGLQSGKGVLDYVPTGDGFLPDGSFIQHTTIPYNGGYGLALILDFTGFANTYAGTSWPVAPPVINKEAGILLTSFLPLVYNGEIMDGVRGRNISRQPADSHSQGRMVISTFLLASNFVSDPTATLLRRYAKYWLLQDTTFPRPVPPPASDTTQTPTGRVTYGFNLAQTVAVDAVLANGSPVTPLNPPAGFHMYAGMDRAVQIRPTWGAELSMYSTRIKDFEFLDNGENLKGWYTGSGMLYLYDSDEQQYGNDFWPTVDNTLQQGATTLDGVSFPSVMGESSIVGGVVGGTGDLGLAAMRLDSTASDSGQPDLHAKKSYFFLDNQIVCLGTNVTSSDPGVLRTILANRKLLRSGDPNTNGTNAATTASGTFTTSPPSDASWTTISSPYVHIAGNTDGSSYGVALLTDPSSNLTTLPTLDVKRELRTKAWTDIDQHSPYDQYAYTLPVSNSFYEVSLNHRNNSPSYAYSILPGRSANDVAAYAGAPDVTVLENQVKGQAIAVPRLGLTGAMFWQNATHTAGTGTNTILSTGVAAVIEVAAGGTLTISISDPTQTATNTIHLQFGRKGTLISKDPAINVTSADGAKVILDFNPTGLAGATAKAVFTLN